MRKVFYHKRLLRRLQVSSTKIYTALFACFLATCNTSYADSLSALSLKNTSMCGSINKLNVVLDSDSLEFFGNQFSNELVKIIDDKFAAYRIFESCGKSKIAVTLFAEVSYSSASASGIRAFMIQTRVQGLVSEIVGPVTLWDTVTFGYSGRTVSDQKDKIQLVIKEQIDGFAADWARAHP